ncbi:hypothetical protein Tco_1084292 [Tanacetum coccineum]
MSIDGTAPNIPPTFKDPKMYTDEEKKMIKLDKPTWSILIQRLGNDSYSLIDSNKRTKELWDALERQMRGFEYGEQDRKAPVLYEYETFKVNEGGKHFDTYLRFLQVINDLKKCGFEKDNCELNYKFLSTHLILATDQTSRQLSEVGVAPGTKSIWNSTCRIGGNPGKSSGKTYGKSRTVDTSLIRFSVDLSLFSFIVTCAINS